MSRADGTAALEVSEYTHGYRHPGYAESLAEFGEPLRLPQSGGWLLVRSIEGTEWRDATGIYPLLFCETWERLLDDLAALPDDVVSVMFVPEPFAELPIAAWQGQFEVLRPYKEHYIADFSEAYEAFVSRGHRKRARQALRRVEVTWANDPSAHLDTWTGLYANLCERHGIAGLRAFSRAAFAKQLSLPGAHYLEARLDGKPVGGNIVFVQGGLAFGHLSAFSEAGYACRAAYAVKWRALEHLSSRVQGLWLGAGAGVDSDEGSGLTAFKRGWTNRTRTVYLCGYVRNQAAYAELTRRRGRPVGAADGFFPAYREGIA